MSHFSAKPATRDTRRNRCRSTIERLNFVATEIARGCGPTSATLAKKWECNLKTIHRDIEFLRDRLQHQLYYDPCRWGWFYRTPADLIIKHTPATT